jgi:hypothetical protein
MDYFIFLPLIDSLVSEIRKADKFLDVNNSIIFKTFSTLLNIKILIRSNSSSLSLSFLLNPFLSILQFQNSPKSVVS